MPIQIERETYFASPTRNLVYGAVESLYLDNYLFNKKHGLRL